MTESDKRGYLWASAAMALMLTAVILWPTPKPDTRAAAGTDTIAEEAHDSIRHYVRKPARHTYRHSDYQRKETDWSTLYDHNQEYHSKYDRFVVEINGADTTDLKELKGIGSTYARRIVKYRELLGGYRSCEQLKEVYGMTDSLYALIAPHLKVDVSEVRKIDLNAVTLDQLKRHPYLDYYQAKAIVRYREQQGAYTTTEDLLNITIIDQDTYNRIKEYITI